MSHTKRYNPDSHSKDAPERRYVYRKVKRTKEEKEALYKSLYTPEGLIKIKGDNDQSS